ncbi:circularly permuted type 2 ATP-grasp protein [Sulfuracidifex metallicus]|uniref:circularly permuted type 2 ATP-grasp protein n=1 Tax=Sulfuracidifex metallicus TaxID=47303 RepID=UPI002276ADA2|nr:circularly permuted type 2 ATP-grasp protein [Sulfuracidifex metallicus]MCY0849228.1 circularly permuted type 2 ATP-grasp protein [Sulfuracidifex metallicus]
MLDIKLSGNDGFFEYNDERYKQIIEKFNEIDPTEVSSLVNRLAALSGFTFYTGSFYRPIKIDPIPRILTRAEFQEMGLELRKRMIAINRLLYDVYHDKPSRLSEELVVKSPYFRPEMFGFDPPHGIYVHIMGEDIVKVNGNPIILEDNVRVPSGMSYAKKSQEIVESILKLGMRSTDGLNTMTKTLINASETRDPVIAILTEGTYNSAYFEHKFYSDRMNLLLIEPSDLRYSQGEVLAKTVEGDVKIDVIYRRIEDLDILTPGLMKAYLRGDVSLVNAPGTGIADDKMTFCFMPQIMEDYGIRSSLRQPFSLPAEEAKEETLEKLVLKRREGYGGTGTFIMSELDRDKRAVILKEVRKNPSAFIAQEFIDFDTVLSVIDDKLYETYADLRFFQFTEGISDLVLSRVAPVGSKITNNSSGGLVKPVWVK